ncbi:MAG: alpha/beta fold hydrolase [Mycobacteriaceae bacterium]
MSSRSRTVTASDGVGLAVTEHGPTRAPTVVLIHGYPDSSAVWDDVVALLSSELHVVTYDVRGAGRSERPVARDGYRIEQLARDLHAVLDAVAPTGTVHLAAHDWGSVPTWTSVRAPGAAERIASFTSISGPGLDELARWTRARVKDRAWSQLLVQALRSWYVGVFQVPVVADQLMRWMGHSPARQTRFFGGMSDTRVRDAVAGLGLYRANAHGVVARPALTPTPTVVPVQLVIPTGDPFLSERVYDDLHETVDTLFVRRIASGHWPQRSHPRAVATFIRELVAHAEGYPTPPGLAHARVGRSS